MTDDPPQFLTQKAPYPTILADLVNKTAYRPGWQVHLEDMQRDDDHGRGEAGGLTLVIFADVYDSYHPERHRPVNHYFVVPAATYSERSWKRWLFERFRDVESHECAENFVIDGERPFAPNHGPGCDPYTIVEYATDEDRRTSFRGMLNA